MNRSPEVSCLVDVRRFATSFFSAATRGSSPVPPRWFTATYAPCRRYSSAIAYTLIVISISGRFCGVEGVEYAADSCETAGDGSHFASQQLGEGHDGYIRYLVTA